MREIRSSRAKKRRMRRRIIRQLFWRSMVSLLGILILLMTWNLTSCALKYFSTEEAFTDNITDDKEGEEDSDNLSKKDAALVSASADEILLVNKDHPLPEHYQPNLERMREYGAEVDASILQPLRDMLAAGEKEGLSFWIASSYRSVERQRELLDEDINTLVKQGYSYSKAYEEVTKETMPVGCSEHASGLAVDIISKEYQILDEKQARTDEILWLQENCGQYGFILRYPKEKEEITKVSYESWHFRYVGITAAEEIMEQGLTLEEYLGF